MSQFRSKQILAQTKTTQQKNVKMFNIFVISNCCQEHVYKKPKRLTFKTSDDDSGQF